MEDDPDSFFNKDDPQDAIISQAVHALHLKKTQASSTHILLTVNAKPEVTLQLMVKKINKLVKKKWLTDYLIVIEQRGEDLSNLGKGIHFHALLPRAIEPARIRKELASTVTSICDTTNSSCFNIRWTKEKELSKIIKYLQGSKKDSAKTKKLEMDLIYRTQNNLPNLLYPTGSTLFELASNPTTTPGPSTNTTTQSPSDKQSSM